VAAVRGVMYSIRGLVRDGATHIGIATDHVIESSWKHWILKMKPYSGYSMKLKWKTAFFKSLKLKRYEKDIYYTVNFASRKRCFRSGSG
jgi:hypothetical protein